MPKDKKTRLQKAKEILKKFAIPIAGVSAATIIGIAAALSKKDNEEAFVFHSLSDLSEEEFKRLMGRSRGKGFAEDVGLPKGPFTRQEVGLIQPVVGAINPQAGDMLDVAVAGDDFVKGRGEPKERPKRRKANDWIKHVREYARKHDLSYRDALKGAGATYKKKK